MEGVRPNRVVVDDALNNAINKLCKAFGDNRQSPVYLETIPKVGYRLIAPVEYLSSPRAQKGEAKAQTGNQADVSVRRRWIVGSTVVSSLLLIMLAIGLQRSSEKTEVGRTEFRIPVFPLGARLYSLVPTRK